ncbi:MAG TPA: hypothetical protein VJ777_05210 [Mycobacterium sp.]|nr:hypothetical protein [Mycobacterium sp.]
MLFSLLLSVFVGAVTWKAMAAWNADKGDIASVSLTAALAVFALYQVWDHAIHPARFRLKVAVPVCCVLIVLIASTVTWPAVTKVARIGGDRPTAQPGDPVTDPTSPTDTEGAVCEEKPYAATDSGPDRPLDPPGQSNVPTFNNGIDPDNGADNRTWLVSARDAIHQDSPQPNGGYEQSIEVNEQSSYRIRFQFWNNADRRPGMEINDVRAFVRLPECSSTHVRLVGTVEGDNATPNSIWGTVHFNSTRPFKLLLAPDGGPGHRPVVCWPSTVRCNPDGTGFVPFDPNQLVGPEGLALPGGTLIGQSGVFILLYVRPVFD